MIPVKLVFENGTVVRVFIRERSIKKIFFPPEPSRWAIFKAKVKKFFRRVLGRKKIGEKTYKGFHGKTG